MKRYIKSTKTLGYIKNIEWEDENNCYGDVECSSLKGGQIYQLGFELYDITLYNYFDMERAVENNTVAVGTFVRYEGKSRNGYEFRIIDDTLAPIDCFEYVDEYIRLKLTVVPFTK